MPRLCASRFFFRFWVLLSFRGLFRAARRIFPFRADTLPVPWSAGRGVERISETSLVMACSGVVGLSFPALIRFLWTMFWISLLDLDMRFLFLPSGRGMRHMIARNLRKLLLSLGDNRRSVGLEIDWIFWGMGVYGWWVRGGTRS